jgi:hypothetical protein
LTPAVLVGEKSNGKRIHLGHFDDLIEAARAYNIAAKKFHGKFSRLNRKAIGGNSFEL